MVELTRSAERKHHFAQVATCPWNIQGNFWLCRNRHVNVNLAPQSDVSTTNVSIFPRLLLLQEPVRYGCLSQEINAEKDHEDGAVRPALKGGTTSTQESPGHRRDFSGYPINFRHSVLARRDRSHRSREMKSGKERILLSEEYKRAIIDSLELKGSLDRKTLEVETLKRQVAKLTAQVETLKTRPLTPSPLSQQPPPPPPPLTTNFKPTPLLLPQRAPAQTQPATKETGSTRSLPYDLPGQGTPQGSILSPLLFNVGLRKLALELEEQQDLGCAIYADITLWATRGSYGDRQDTRQRAIDVVETFTRQAGMKCVPAKSTYVHIGPKNTQAKRAPAIQLYLDGEPIKRAANMRVLGMHVQETGSVSVALSKLKPTEVFLGTTAAPRLNADVFNLRGRGAQAKELATFLVGIVLHAKRNKPRAPFSAESPVVTAGRGTELGSRPCLPSPHIMCGVHVSGYRGHCECSAQLLGELALSLFRNGRFEPEVYQQSSPSLKQKYS
ncbi:hypothetical protein HPB50_000166 [Hyalomma asiaticum]|uniref:Uncharacterized protein n=1 Tax=Hyalomma asiaticum TaxID=266040 RepID=A0ACB7TCU9_HYAAI|nr:hypothetical protein HPB50_000166 [Hyalomma asiaticum]